MLPTHALLEKRKQAAKSQAHADADALFNTLTTLRSLPEDWIIGFLAKISDFQVADILACKREDGDAPWRLLFFGTQVPLHVQLWPELQVKEVMQRFLLAMAEYRNRLKTFKARGGIAASSVVWKKGCYDCEFVPTTGKLKKMTHMATKEEVAIEDTYIYKTWKLDNNWSDHAACFRKGHSPPYKVTSFFTKGQGPLLFPAVTARHKDAHTLALQLHKQWLDEIALTKSADGTNIEAQQALKELQKEVRKSATEKMRETGMEQVRAKRAKRMSSFDE